MIALIAALCFQGQLSDMEKEAQRHPSAAIFRSMADGYVASGRFQTASLYFRKAADAYQGLGDPNAAKVLRIQAQRYETVIRLYFERAHSPAKATLARLEPEYGCYVGAFIDRDDGIESTLSLDGREHHDPQFFDLAVGKKQAVYFNYMAYGKPFPSDWADLLRKRKAAMHIAWEPQRPDSVQDNGYLHDFARKARDSGIPIFLRFAGEMNGTWTPYHGDPAAYRSMFSLVARVMHAEAPNVAMVWCPNEIPEDEIPSYYPGEDSVDWVGVNFYSVLFNDADRTRGAEWRNPADALHYIYDRYSRLHPIMIGEWAASHMSVVDNKERSDFSVVKIRQLYASLPRLYPRLKSVQWLSMNTIRYAMPGRQLNDFSLLSNPLVTEAYAKAIAPDYFLSSVAIDAHPDREIAELLPGSLPEPSAHMSAWVKSYEGSPTVIWSVNGVERQRTADVGTYDFTPTTPLHKGDRVGLRVMDGLGRVADSREVRL